DPLTRGQLHDGRLPGARATRVQPPPLRLRLHLRSANRAHLDVEDLLDGVCDLKLVRPLVHPERVLALPHQGVALLRDHGPDDHLARLHQTARPLSSSRAASEITSDVAPMTSATPAALARATVTPGMLRKLFATVSSSEPITTRVGLSAPHLRRASAAFLVAGSP